MFLGRFLAMHRAKRWNHISFMSSVVPRSTFQTMNLLSTVAGLIALLGYLLENTAVCGFSPHGTRIATRHSTRLQNSLGSWVSGVAGVPPAQLLEPKLLEDLCSQTSLENVELSCAYKASKDGWSAIDFHDAVDGRGSCLVVVLSRSGALFGGFNPLGWMSTDDYGSSNAAFLWFAKSNNVVKCPVLQGGNAAIFDYATGGPNFGPADLVVGKPQAAVLGGFAGPDMMDTSINAGNMREGSSAPGGAYDVPRGWPAGGTFKVTEIEVYCNSKVQPQIGGGLGSWWPF